MSSCFVCLRDTPPLNKKGKRLCSVGNTKRLLTTVCTLFHITDISDDDWSFFETCEDPLICVTCIEVFQSCQKTFDLLQKTEVKLKHELEKIKDIVTKSGDVEKANVSWWRPSCFKFRNHVSGRKVSSEVITTFDGSRSPAAAWTDDWFQDDSNGNDQQECSSLRRRKRRKILVISEEDEEPLKEKEIQSDGHSLSQRFKEWSQGIGALRGSGQVDAGTDAPYIKLEEVENVPSNSDACASSSDKYLADKDIPSSSTTPTTLSHVKVEHSLHEHKHDSAYVIVDKVNDVQNISEPSASTSFTILQEEHDIPSPPSSPPVAFPHESHPIKVVPRKLKHNCTHVNCTRAFTSLYGLKYHVDISHTPPEKQWSKSPGFHLPFQIVTSNLFLYKTQTFVEYNFTHLICKNFNCSFRVEFDYYPSFQVMRDHIEENHRGHAIQRSLKCYLCFVCDPAGRLNPGREFRKHFLTAHPELSHKNGLPQGVCECCLRPLVTSRVMIHQFHHKNAAELAAAKQIGVGPAGALKPKIRDLTEKPFKCSHEGCSFAAKTKRLLARHSKIHLPREERLKEKAICAECGDLVDARPGAMETHMKRWHHKEGDVQHLVHCPECDKRFLIEDRQMLQEHLKVHRGERAFICEECGRSYHSKSQLKAHWRDNHVAGEWKCELCPDKDTIYTKLSTFRGHWKKHSPLPFPGSKTHWISQRGKKGPSVTRFYNGVEVKQKAKRLAPKRKWPCDLCDVVCAAKHVLQKHKIRIHPGK